MPRRGQEPVADGMERHVAVGVAMQSRGLREVEAGQAQAVEAAEGVAVRAPRVPHGGRRGLGGGVPGQRPDRVEVGRVR